MVIQQQLYTVDDVWDLSHQAENAHHDFYLIDGELYTTMPPGGLHGELAGEISRLIGNFVREHDLGRFTVEAGFHPREDRNTLLAPDVAFLRKARAPQPFPVKFIPVMPDLAVEIASPGDSLKALRRKAEVYLGNGTSLVWIVMPAEKGVDVCRAADGSGLNIEFVGQDGTLSGEAVLPGFELDVSVLFPFSED